MTQPTLWDAVGVRHCPIPLTVDDERRLFADWIEANPLLVEQMEGWALTLESRTGRVEVNGLFFLARSFSDYKIVPVKFEDDSGKAHEYGLNNTFRALFSRYLLKKYPSMHIELRRSKFDEEGA